MENTIASIIFLKRKVRLAAMFAVQVDLRKTTSACIHYQTWLHTGNVETYAGSRLKGLEILLNIATWRPKVNRRRVTKSRAGTSVETARPGRTKEYLAYAKPSSDC